MGKLVVVSLGRSDLGTGFPYVSAQVWSDEHSVPARLTGGLPAAREITRLYQRWQELYRVFYKRGLRKSAIEIAEDDITNFSETEFGELRQQLQQQINIWLDSGEFRYIESQLRSYLNMNEEIQVVLEAEDDLLQRLPWQLWNFFRDYRQAEVALSSPDYRNPSTKISRSKLRILAILGDSSGIDIQTDRKLLETLPNAETIFLVEPERREVDQWLWDEQGWDILFFAGHSQTEAETGHIHINPTESLTISDLNNALNKAIEHGLQFAIFNSCDGLGLARQMANLNIPQMIVMREPVPDRIAQEFLKYFLSAFSGGKSVYASVREARERLQGLEGEFPCASWLPALCHNPAAKTLTWQELVDRLLQPSSPTRPYQGLFAFQEKDTSLFFGRETFVNQLVEAVRTRHLVAVVGPSGSGKSSVVFAGLVPHLRATNEWQIISCRLGDRPFQALAVELVPLLDSNLGRTERILRTRQLGTSLQQEELKLHEVIRDILSEASNPRLLLVIDQFEELYTLCRIPEERQKFLDQLLEAVNSPLRLTVVLTLRADFYGQALSSRPFSDALQGTDVKLGPMNREELQDAIVKPAELFGVQVEPGLTGRILDEIKQEPGSLPLLEFALTQLWDKRSDNRLTHAAYNEIGGVKAALARYADEVYEQLTPEAQKRTEQVFIQLVRPGEGTEDTRRVAIRSEVGEENWTLVRQLADARLVVTGRIEKPAKETASDTEEQPSIQAEETVEVVHEALIREWQRLREWMNASRDFRTWQEGLKVEMRQWQNMGRDEGALLRGAPLTVSEDWLHKRQSELSADEQEYIQEGLRIREQEQAEREKQQVERLHLQRRAIYGLAGGLAFSLILALLAGTQWLRAETQKRQAETSEVKALSASSERLFASDQKFDALMESLRAGARLKQASWTDDKAQSQLAAMLQQSVYGVRERNRLEGHDSRVTSVSISPDGQMLVSAGADGTIKLWNLDGTLIKSLQAHTGSVNGVSFSPDGKQIASVGDDGTIRLWDLSGKQIGQWADKEELSGGIGIRIGDKPSDSDKTKITMLVTEVVANSPAQNAGVKKGDLLLSVNGKAATEITVESAKEIINTEIRGQAGTTVTLRISRQGTQDFDLSIKRESVTFPNALHSLSFSPDSKNIVTAGDGGTVKLWNLDGTVAANLKGHTGIVRRVNFSPDGKLIATASLDGTVKLWKPNGTLYKSLNHQDGALAVQFSPKGDTFVTSDGKGNIGIWSRDGIFLKAVNNAHNGDVLDFTFSPDGQKFASLGSDGTVKLWNSGGTLIETFKGHRNQVSSAVFSPDGQVLATASDDRSIRLWTVKSTLVRVFGRHDNGVNDVRFTPDGQTLVSTGGDNKVKVWDLQGKIQKSWDASGTAWGVVPSPDGQTIATFGSDKVVKLWDRNGNNRAALNGHSDSVLDVSFSPDGKLIASVSKDRTTRLWNIDGTLVKVLENYSDQNKAPWIKSVSFSPDGQVLATVSGDTVKLWDRNGTQIKVLKGHRNYVTRVIFSLDSSMIATASFDKTINIWNTNGTLLTTLQFQDEVYGVSFSPDSKKIAASGKDGTVKIWGIDGRLLSTFQGHSDFVLNVNFSPDGKTLASASNDGKIILWNLDFDTTKMIVKGCYWVKNYLKSNLNVEEKDRHICDGVEQDWETEGEKLALAGNIQDAIAAFQKFKEKNPGSDFDPEKKAKQIRATALIDDGIRLVIQGKVPEALSAYKDAQTMNPEIQISAESWNSLCWFGSKHGYPAQVIDACQKAVDANTEGYYRDSLGLAKLLTGDNTGAALDFQAWVDWWNKNKDNWTDEVQKKKLTRISERRQRWIKTLKAGQQLFSPNEINLLWEEE